MQVNKNIECRMRLLENVLLAILLLLLAIVGFVLWWLFSVVGAQQIVSTLGLPVVALDGEQIGFTDIGVWLLRAGAPWICAGVFGLLVVRLRRRAVRANRRYFT